MSNAAEGAWIRTRLAAWQAAQPANTRPDVAWQNAPYTPGSKPWLRPLVRRASARPASLGPGAAQRYDGMLVIEVRTPIATGTAANDALCDKLEALYRGVQDAGLRWWTPWTVTVGNVDGWYKQDVLCPFQRDTTY
jgi:hypothetical protein